MVLNSSIGKAVAYAMAGMSMMNDLMNDFAKRKGDTSQSYLSAKEKKKNTKRKKTMRKHKRKFKR